MRCIHIHKTYIYAIFSHLHHVSLMVFVFLICSTHSYAAALPGASTAHPKAEIVTIQIGGPPPGFSPAFLTLHVNDKVVFVNHAFPARSHTLSANDGSFSSPPIPAGGQWAITFHAPGSHTYRDTSATSTMIGELMVVAQNIQLLATPDPLVEATAITFIRNGKNPPDTITIRTYKHAIASSSSSLIPRLILIVGITMSVILLCFLGIIFYRRRKQRARSIDEDLDDDVTILDDDDRNERMQQIRTIVDNARKKLQTYPPFKGAKSEEEDDYDDF